ncbi:flagellar hook-basal body protein [Sphingomonas sp. CFBP 13720]|uniref:flagellar hook-basal body protein n=1 Tax=Sphingomonas sp. CFBP 13720 TaxID=2775302 RepID=UPI001784308A|nr:flagellar hook basal-body protein [Sphingomonas sp. CFBP 13720]MBD8679339.1 flagellar hook basal-body protein [Sphingomonas sp. CFBP 13720]
MSGLVDSATAVMRMAQMRLDVTAHNVANIATPGYKRRIGFDETIAARTAPVGEPVALSIHVDRAQAPLSQTGNPFDLAISGDGYFRVRDGDRTLYTRQGQFRRDGEGLLVTPQGYVLQQVGGGDVTIDGATATIMADGTIVDAGRPVGRVAVDRGGDPARMTAVGESFFASTDADMAEATDAVVRQGMLEASNVSLGDEMTHTMVAVRQAESGAKLIQLYDELMGRAASVFGGGR